jgi:hypothetical protein
MTQSEERGWDLFDHDDGTGILELQRDDEAAVFDSDDAAWKHVIGRLKSNFDPASVTAAVALLENWRPLMHDVMRGEDSKGRTIAYFVKALRDIANNPDISSTTLASIARKALEGYGFSVSSHSEVTIVDNAAPQNHVE